MLCRTSHVKWRTRGPRRAAAATATGAAAPLPTSPRSTATVSIRPYQHFYEDFIEETPSFYFEDFIEEPSGPPAVSGLNVDQYQEMALVVYYIAQAFLFT